MNWCPASAHAIRTTVAVRRSDQGWALHSLFYQKPAPSTSPPLWSTRYTYTVHQLLIGVTDEAPVEALDGDDVAAPPRTPATRPTPANGSSSARTIFEPSETKGGERTCNVTIV